MINPLPVAVIGAGHMGRHHVRKYAAMQEAQLVAVVDRDIERAREHAEPVGAKAVEALTPDLGEIAAVSIAVPTVHHLAIAQPLIERGIAVLIEKPLAPSASEAQAIADLARKHDTIVAVGHTERFNPAVRAVDRLGITPKFVETHRISPFTFRSADVGTVLDMMIHDIDIVLHLVGENVSRVDAVGVSVLSKYEDIANARVMFDQGAVANLTASRLALKTERKLRVFSERAYVSLDYQKRTGIAVMLEKNVDVLKFARDHNLDDLSQLAGVDFTKLVQVEPLLIEEKDALEDELQTFLRCVREKQRPPVSADDGVAAVRLAEQIVASIEQHRWDGERGDRVGPRAEMAWSAGASESRK